MSKLENLVNVLNDLGGKPKEVQPEVNELMISILKEKPDVKPEMPTTSDTFYVNPPRLPYFSGRDPPGETLYDLWHCEVLCLLTDKPLYIATMPFCGDQLEVMLEKVLMLLGPQTYLGRVIESLDSVLGVVEEKKSVMRKFYNATQGDNEPH